MRLGLAANKTERSQHDLLQSERTSVVNRFRLELTGNVLWRRCVVSFRLSRLISYARGRVQVLDRVGLESRCCKCHTVVKREYDRLFPMEIDSVDRRDMGEDPRSPPKEFF